ncbi:hypothetical protein GCM10022246_12290 [Pedobacter ginsengiterrae]|uniref:Uncharacterized protein n=1 Tax=Pedobacter ginsengiterrae TaxID=871696 RepID=A0ABP7P6L9_9SPHI
MLSIVEASPTDETDLSYLRINLTIKKLRKIKPGKVMTQNLKIASYPAMTIIKNSYRLSDLL